MKMKNLSIVLAIMLILFGLGTTPAFATELEDVSALETGTYKVTVSDKSVDMGQGFFMIENENGEFTDFIIIKDLDYGYIYFDASYKGLSYIFRNVELELVDTEDLGVSGYHVYNFLQRDFDPLIDEEYIPQGSNEDFD